MGSLILLVLVGYVTHAGPEAEVADAVCFVFKFIRKAYRWPRRMVTLSSTGDQEGLSDWP